jgi:hypothetical protein
MRNLLIIILSLISFSTFCQEIETSNSLNTNKKFIFGVQAGVGWAYEDEAHLYNTSFCISIDYQLKNGLYIQFAPQYSWLWNWNEHYLTLPIHLRKKIGNKFSLFAGLALTFDIGYFKDLGISGGAYYHISNRSALALSVFTFTLYEYFIDYLYAPVSISYRFAF